ncbi:hypothetical protein CI109_102020 [Kwoniella shandongensis]|uniref:Uncharacterized protein n=1 Tax=Kwoniella shandongensis TaxID=1734106 RepID=A0A5M6BST5_9TREE|nr:uncharacterized protein CI109_006544 [Kwoniella shandongensis]KAA5525082.1 hypothetical protein CI109_006544 [Kwoniella shandongensis]
MIEEGGAIQSEKIPKVDGHCDESSQGGKKRKYDEAITTGGQEKPCPEVPADTIQSETAAVEEDGDLHPDSTTDDATAATTTERRLTPLSDFWSDSEDDDDDEPDPIPPPLPSPGGISAAAFNKTYLTIPVTHFALRTFCEATDHLDVWPSQYTIDQLKTLHIYWDCDPGPSPYDWQNQPTVMKVCTWLSASYKTCASLGKALKCPDELSDDILGVKVGTWVWAALKLDEEVMKKGRSRRINLYYQHTWIWWREVLHEIGIPEIELDINEIIDLFEEVADGQ